MSGSSEFAHRAPMVFAPRQATPKLLFVLLHDDSAAPEQMNGLVHALTEAFPASLVMLPYGPLSSSENSCHWFEQSGLLSSNYVQRVRLALPNLIAQIRHLQARYGITGEHTALAGFGQGATMALEASQAQPDLAGRVLAFSGSYAQLPAQALPATTLHFLHGENDAIVPVSAMQETHSHLGDLQADSTLDIASQVGHELHDALINQAIVRLQTCIPLRSWRAAFSELPAQDVGSLDDGGDTSLESGRLPGPPPSRRLH